MVAPPSILSCTVCYTQSLVDALLSDRATVRSHHLQVHKAPVPWVVVDLGKSSPLFGHPPKKTLKSSGLVSEIPFGKWLIRFTTVPSSESESILRTRLATLTLDFIHSFVHGTWKILGYRGSLLGRILTHTHISNVTGSITGHDLPRAPK